MDEELFRLAQDPTYSPGREKELEEETIVPRSLKHEESLSRLAQDPTYTPERKEITPAAEDYLFLSYPNRKEAITEARVKGYSDDAILERFALYEKNLLLEKQPADVSSFFGRTGDSEAGRRRYLQINRIGAISEVTGLEPKEVFVRTKEAEAVGVNPEAFFADEDFYRLAKSSGVVKERMSIAQNVINGVKISKLRDERGALYHDNLLCPSDGIAKRIQEIDKEIEELMPPAYNPGLNKAFFDAANSMGSWVDSQDLWMAAGGLAFSALAAPFIAPAAGVTLGTAAIGATAVSAAKMAYNTSMISRMFLRESAEFNEDIVKEGVPQYAALPASALYGAISAGIEYNMFSGVLSSFGSKIGGNMIMDYVRRQGKRAIKGFAANPAIAPRLEKLTSAFLVKQALKSPSVAGAAKAGVIRLTRQVWDEDVEEMMQKAAEIIIGEPLKMAMLPDYKHMTLSEALGSIADAGIEALPSLVLMMAPGSAYSTARSIGAVRSFQNSGEGKRVKAAENIFTDEGSPVAENNLVFLGQDAVNEFFQTNPDIADEVVSTLGITESSVIDELGEVAVRKEDYEKTAAAHPSFAKSLEMDTREGPGGMTKKEVAERLSEKLQDPLEQDDEYAKGAVEIRRTINSELSAASKDGEASQANADLYSRYLYTLGKRLGISPKELHKMRVERAEDERTKTLYDQSVWHDQAVKVMETYYQPLNPDVDRNQMVNAVDLRGVKPPKGIKTLGDLKAYLLSLPEEHFTTADSKAIIDVLHANADHIAFTKSPLSKINIPPKEHVAARNKSIVSLRDLIENSVLIESVPNTKIQSITQGMSKGQINKALRKNRKSVYHRFYVPITIDGINFHVVRLVAEEDGKVITVNPTKVDLYDVIIEDKKAGKLSASLSPQGPNAALSGSLQVSIHDLLKNVPDSKGNPYFTQGKRGGITFNRKTGESLVTLFRTADRSTFIHEMGHLILEDLIRYGYKADPDTEIGRDLKTALDYLGISNMDLSDLNGLDETQQSRLTEAHEKWARAMEMYVMDGNAPSKALRSVFQKMRMWLLDIYSNAKFAGEELTPEVQDVFDRLLATPQEVDESYIAETTIGDLIKENELLKERLENFEKEKKREANNKFRLGEALGYDRGKSEGERGSKFKRPGFDYKTQSRQEAMFERLQKRKALLKDVEALLEGINHDVNDEKVIWSVQQEMLDKLAKSRQIADLHDTELDKKRPNRRRRKSKFAAVYPTQKMKMTASLMEAIRQDLGLDYKDINPADAPFVKLIEKLEAAGMTLNDLRLSDAKLAEIADLAKEISEIHARGRREYEVWRAGIVERRNKINTECVSALDKTDSKAKQGPVTGPSDLPKQYDGIMGKAEKLKDWTYANTLGAIRLFDWIGHGLGKFDSAFSRYCVDEVNAAYDTKLRHIQERHDAMNAKMKELGITFHALSKERAVGKYKYSVDKLLSIYAAMQNDKSSQALIFGNMRALIPDSWFLDNAKKHDTKPPAETLAHIGECIKALSPQERELADYVIREYGTHYGRMNSIFIANFNQGMMKEENYTPMRRLEYTSNHGLENADEAAYAKGVATQAGAQKAGLERGFLNPRVIPGKEISVKHQAPVDLGLLSIWNTQVDAMEHTAAFARIGPDLNAVFTENFEDRTGRSYNIPKLIREKFGSGTWKAVLEYINLVNRDELTVGNDAFSRIANTLGKNMAYTYLAANIGTVLKQTTSIPRFLITAGPAQIGCAIGEYLQHPKQFLEDIYAMDPQMRDRVPNVFFSINKYDPTIMGDAQYAYKKSMDTLIAPISYMDRVVAAIGWKATYESNVKRGLSREQAVRAAQRAVLLTQQAPMIKDAPMVWRQSGLARLLMIFTSDAAPVLGMTAYDLAQSVKRGDHPASLCNIAALMISAVAMKALVDGMPDDDNDESWGEWVLSAFSRQAVESIPLVGKELMSFWESFSGQGYKGTTYSAFVAPLSKLARGFDDMTAEDSDEISPYTGMSKFERGAWNAIEGMSLITTPLPVVGAKRLYLATKNTADGDFMKALQAIIGQRKTMKKYSVSPEI